MKRDCAFLDMRIEMEMGTATRSSVLAQRLQGQRSLLGFRAHGVAELDRTERLRTRGRGVFRRYVVTRVKVKVHRSVVSTLRSHRL